MTEVAFPQPMDAVLEPIVDLTGAGAGHRLGWLYFVEPKYHHRNSLPVTDGEGYDHPVIGPVWHIEITGDRATTHPSVHWPGQWHSPNPAQWRIVPELTTLGGQG